MQLCLILILFTFQVRDSQLNHVLGQILTFYPIVIYSKLSEVIGDESFTKLKKHLNKQIKRYNELKAWKDEDLEKELKKVHGRSFHYINEILYLRSL